MSEITNFLHACFVRVLHDPCMIPARFVHDLWQGTNIISRGVLVQYGPTEGVTVVQMSYNCSNSKQDVQHVVAWFSEVTFKTLIL